jgi:hypothetical protein
MPGTAPLSTATAATSAGASRSNPFEPVTRTRLGWQYPRGQRARTVALGTSCVVSDDRGGASSLQGCTLSTRDYGPASRLWHRAAIRRGASVRIAAPECRVLAAQVRVPGVPRLRSRRTAAAPAARLSLRASYIARCSDADRPVAGPAGSMVPNNLASQRYSIPTGEGTYEARRLDALSFLLESR